MIDFYGGIMEQSGAKHIRGMTDPASFATLIH